MCRRGQRLERRERDTKPWKSVVAPRQPRCHEPARHDVTQAACAKRRGQTVKLGEAIGQYRGRWLAATVAILASVLAFLVAKPASSASMNSLQAETMGLPSSSLIFTDDAASGGKQ
jgi:hypothetical protein